MAGIAKNIFVVAKIEQYTGTQAHAIQMYANEMNTREIKKMSLSYLKIAVYGRADVVKDFRFNLYETSGACSPSNNNK